MAVQEEDLSTQVVEVQESIDLHVDGEWSAAELETLLSATRRIYNAGLAAYLASREEIEVSEGPIEPEQQAIRVDFEHLGVGEPGRLTVEGSSYEVADTVHAAIQRIMPQMSIEPEPGVLPALRETKSFRLRLLQDDLLALAPEAQLGIERIAVASLGVISLKGLGEPIKQVGKLIERLVRLPHKVKMDKLSRDKVEHDNATDAALDQIKIARERMAAIEDFLQLTWGPDFRSVPGIADQIREVVSGVGSITDLAQSGRLLPAPGD